MLCTVIYCLMMQPTLFKLPPSRSVIEKEKIECFQMTLRRLYWCSKQILWQLNSFFCSKKSGLMLATRVKTLHRQESSRIARKKKHLWHCLLLVGRGMKTVLQLFFFTFPIKKFPGLCNLYKKKNICSGIRESILLTKLDPSHVVYLRTEVQASKNMNYGKCGPECK